MATENKTEKFTVRLKKKTLKNLERRAETEQRKTSEMARMIIEKELDR